jgi:photosystem II stability/assembly factor-like uncharacterized protein
MEPIRCRSFARRARNALPVASLVLIALACLTAVACGSSETAADSPTAASGSGWQVMPDVTASAPSARCEVSFSDAQHGWIVAAHEAGVFGEVWSTTDGGDTWTAVGKRISDATEWSRYSSVVALSADHVVLGSESHTAVTRDGGRSWGGGTGPPTQVMSFLDDDTGVGCNRLEAGAGAMSDDGGHTWTKWKIEAKGRTLGFNDVAFGSDGSLLACGGLFGQDVATFICLSTDGGRTWNDRNWEPEHGSFVTCVDTVGADCLWAASEVGVLRTLDRGETWPFTGWPLGDFVPEAIDFADAQNGWAVGSSGGPATSRAVILRTRDGGATWTEEEIDADPSPSVLQSVVALDVNHAFATGIADLSDEEISVVALRLGDD